MVGLLKCGNLLLLVLYFCLTEFSDMLQVVVVVSSCYCY